MDSTLADEIVGYGGKGRETGVKDYWNAVRLQDFISHPLKSVAGLLFTWMALDFTPESNLDPRIQQHGEGQKAFYTSGLSILNPDFLNNFSFTLQLFHGPIQLEANVLKNLNKNSSSNFELWKCEISALVLLWVVNFFCS